MTQKVLELLIQGKDDASDELSTVSGGIGGLGSMAAGVATGGLTLLVTAVAAVAVGAGLAVIEIGKLTLEAARLDGVKTTFANLTAEIGGEAEALRSLRAATSGMVSDTDLMAGANRFLAMGLAGSIEEAAEMAEMAVQLGMAMGDEAGPAMENFALMLANQSIPRLDSFAISSSTARDRMNELMEATEGMTREEAFKIVVLEQGALAMEKVGDQSKSATADMAKWDATTANLTDQLGTAFLPVLQAIMPPLTDLLEQLGPVLLPIAREVGTWIGDKLPVAFEWLNQKAVEFKPVVEWIGARFETFKNSLLPELRRAWDLLTEGFEAAKLIYYRDLEPALMDLMDALGLNTDDADGFMEMLGKVFGLMAQQWVKGAIQTVTGLISDMASAVEWVSGAIETADRVIGTFRSTLERISGFIWTVKERVNELKWALANLTLPDWLTPGSPTPLEIGLIGISKALDKVNLDSFTGGAGAGMTVQIHNTYGKDSVRSDADIMRLAEMTARALELRGAGASL